MQKMSVNVVVKTSTSQIRDDGPVRIGMMSPSFPAVRATPASLGDDGKVRTGMMTPAFPPMRAR